jgi:hypothetical protein
MSNSEIEECWFEYSSAFGKDEEVYVDVVPVSRRVSRRETERYVHMDGFREKTQREIKHALIEISRGKFRRK